MKLETPRLFLNPVIREDIRRIHEFHSIKEVAEFNMLGIPIDISVTENLLKDVLTNQPNEYGWTLTIKDTNKFIGELGLGISPELDTGEIHYALIPEVWGKGLATEAVNRILSFGFETLHLQKIEANSATENLRSLKVLEQVGMTKVSIQKKTLLIDDDWKDNYTFSIMPNHFSISEFDPPMM